MSAPKPPQKSPKLKNCVLIVPASGFSSRFGDADKLLAQFRGRPLAGHMAKTMGALNFAQKIAVIPTGNLARANMFKANGFDIAENSNPKRGQDHSIAAGLRAVHPRWLNDELTICIMLADMPLVPASHVTAMFALLGGHECVKTQYQGQLQPPALFSRQAAKAWLDYASGGRSQRPSAPRNQAQLSLPQPLGDDVDTAADLMRLSALA